MTDELIAECSGEAKAEASPGGAVSPTLAVELVNGGLDAFDQIADEWRQMLTQVPDDPPYWRPEWIRAALRARWPKAKVMVVTVRRAGRLCAVLPLKLETGKFWRLGGSDRWDGLDEHDEIAMKMVRSAAR